MKIAVAAAAGNVGSRVARKIAEAGGKSVLLGRDISKLAALELKEAEIVAADISDTNAVIKATEEAKALFWLVPPMFHYASLKEWYGKVITAGVEAVRANRIKKVVAVSSVGAGSGENLGTVTYVGQMEQAFRTLEINFVALRAGYFMENFLQQIEFIKNNNRIVSTFAPDHDIPFISTDDIGDAAARYLLDDRWAEKWSLNLLGPENITLYNAAEILSQTFNKSINYQQISFAEAKQELARARATSIVQREMIELLQALGDPDGIYATPRTFESFTPTTFKMFAKNKLMQIMNSN